MNPWPDHLKDTIEAHICQSIQGNDSPNYDLRKALLVTYHASQCAEKELAYVANWLYETITESPFSFAWFGPVAATGLAEKLEALAKELRKASAAMDAAERFVYRNEGANGAANSTHKVPLSVLGHEGEIQTTSPTGTDTDCPF